MAQDYLDIAAKILGIDVNDIPKSLYDELKIVDTMSNKFHHGTLRSRQVISLIIVNNEEARKIFESNN